MHASSPLDTQLEVQDAMTTIDQIETVLRSHLAPELHASLPGFLQLMAKTASGNLSSAELQRHFDGERALQPLLEALVGRHLVMGRLALGVTVQNDHPAVSIGNVIFTGGGDYAEGNIDKRQGVFVGDGAIVHGMVVGVNYGTIYLYPPDIPPSPEPEHPSQLRGFVGREKVLDDLTKKLETDRLVIITGMAGVGKTDFAVALSAQLAAQVDHVEGIYWHTFHEGQGFGELIVTLAGFLDKHKYPDLWQAIHRGYQSVQKPSEQTAIQLDLLFQILRDRRFVLCFDDFHWIEEDSTAIRFISRFRSAANGSFLIITSRSRHIPEFVHPTTLLEGLDISATHKLLLQHGLKLPDALASQLHNKIDGNPQLLLLAIELLQDTDDRAALIGNLVREEDISMHLLDLVYRHLSAQERGVMKAVAVQFGYPTTRSAIEATLGNGDTFLALNDLINRHHLRLIKAEGGGAMKYTQHALLQEFYYASLGDDERRELHHRAGEYYERKEPNILRAALHFEDAEEYSRAVELITPNVWPMINQGQARTLSQMLERFVQHPTEPEPTAPRRLDREHWAAVKVALGRTYPYTGELKLARQSNVEAFACLAKLPDSSTTRPLKAQVCVEMGRLLKYEAPQVALNWLQQGLDIASRSNLQEQTAELCILTGSIHFSKGDYLAALSAVQRGLSILPAGPSGRPQ
jgi:AAA ATPase domain